MLRPVDLGVCGGYRWEGDPRRVAIGLPGALLAGMPSLAFPLQAAVARGWSAVQVWDEFLDRHAVPAPAKPPPPLATGLRRAYAAGRDPTAWVRERLDAALAAAPGAERLLIVAKSLSTRAAAAAADRAIPAIWLTPLLNDPECVEALRRRSAPALLVGGPQDPAWDGTLARELSEDVLELPRADHGLGAGADPHALLASLGLVVERVDAFLDALG